MSSGDTLDPADDPEDDPGDGPVPAGFVVPAGNRTDALADEQPNGLAVGPDDAQDRFELLGRGIRGGEGVTWRARYAGELARPVHVALKQVRRPATASPTWPTGADLDHWRDQVHLLDTASSPHLVRVHDVFRGRSPHHRGTTTSTVDGRSYAVPYLVMEWIPGPTLEEAVHDGRAPLEQRVAWLCQLAEAVSVLHSATRMAGNPMLHRDIKPANCVLHPHRGLVLVDLGGLRRFDAGPDGRQPYTAHYAAPEVLLDPSAERAPASDLYSVGAVLYFCVVGREPPRPTEPGASEVMRSELAKAARAQGVRHPYQLADEVLGMMAPEPAARPVRAAVWAERVHELVVDAAGRRRRRRWGAAIAGVTALVVGATLSYELLSPAPVAVDTVQRTPSFRVFGQSFAQFPAEVADDRLSMTPPLGQNRYDHLWGFFDTANLYCASVVAFDVQVGAGDLDNGFGVGVAPRSRLTDDQPSGYSVQYEWQPAYVGEPGTYVRPSELPGGAWKIAVPPTPAPDIAAPHHVVVRASGTSMEVDVDGFVQRYTTPAAECGGVSVRVWGAPATITGLHVEGS